MLESRELLRMFMFPQFITNVFEDPLANSDTQIIDEIY